MASKSDTLKSEYSKAYKALKARIKTAEKKGYTFNIEDFAKKPKRITQASVDKIKKLRGKNLYKKAANYKDISGSSKTSKTNKKKYNKGGTKKKETPPASTEPNAPETGDNYPSEPSEDDIGFYDVFDEVKNQIASLFPDYGFSAAWKVRLNFEDEKRRLIWYIDDRLGNSTGQDERAYAKYLTSVEGELMEEINTAREAAPSHAEYCYKSVNYIYTLLKGGFLSLEESKDIEEVNEYYDDFFSEEYL